MRPTWLAGLCLLASLCAMAVLPMRSSALDADEMRTIQIYEQAAPAVVTLTAIQSDGPSSGSGCIVDSRGIIVTSRHVISNASSITATFSDGRVYTAKLLVSNVGLYKDLAILKLQPKHANEHFPAIQMADSESVRVGQRVLAIGNPYGFERTLTLGIVSRMDKQNERIQTDASINPGNSGGPLLNTDGQIIGINQSIFNPEGQKTNIGIGFAIPINVIKPQLLASIGDAVALAPQSPSTPPPIRMTPVSLKSRLRSDALPMSRGYTVRMNASLDPTVEPAGIKMTATLPVALPSLDPLPQTLLAPSAR